MKTPISSNPILSTRVIRISDNMGGYANWMQTFAGNRRGETYDVLMVDWDDGSSSTINASLILYDTASDLLDND